MATKSPSRALAFLLKGLLVPALALLPCIPQARGAEYVLGAGIVGTGLGAKFSVRPENSHWRFGWEYGRTPSSTFEDPYTGSDLTREFDTMTGPFLHYQFKPEAKKSGYLGVSILRWTHEETSLTFGDRNGDSTTDPYFGGGYLYRMSPRVTFNAAMFIGLGAEMTTETSTSSTDSSGWFDIQVTLDFAF